MREAKSAPRALWIEKSTLASCEAKGPLVSAPGEARKVSGCETTLALHRALPRHSREAKEKTHVSAISEVAVASLSAAKTLS